MIVVDGVAAERRRAAVKLLGEKWVVRFEDGRSEQKYARSLHHCEGVSDGDITSHPDSQF